MIVCRLYGAVSDDDYGDDDDDEKSYLSWLTHLKPLLNCSTLVLSLVPMCLKRYGMIEGELCGRHLVSSVSHT